MPNKEATFEKNDFRSIVSRFPSETIHANQVLVDLMGQVAQKKLATSAQVALARILAQKS
jgi:aryl-alcohol dehydrogenase-like predicted oxidoreductase